MRSKMQTKAWVNCRASALNTALTERRNVGILGNDQCDEHDIEGLHSIDIR